MMKAPRSRHAPTTVAPSRVVPESFSGEKEIALP